MALLPTIKRISKEDLGDAPSYMEILLRGINNFFEVVFSALTGDLTFAENFRAQIKEMSFTTLATYSTGDFTPIKFNRTIKARAQWVQIMQITKDAENYEPITNGVTLDWFDNSGVINIGYISGLDNGEKYFVRFLVT